MKVVDGTITRNKEWEIRGGSRQGRAFCGVKITGFSGMHADCCWQFSLSPLPPLHFTLQEAQLLKNSPTVFFKDWSRHTRHENYG